MTCPVVTPNKEKPQKNNRGRRSGDDEQTGASGLQAEGKRGELSMIDFGDIQWPPNTWTEELNILEELTQKKDGGAP